MTERAVIQTKSFYVHIAKRKDTPGNTVTNLKTKVLANFSPV